MGCASSSPLVNGGGPGGLVDSAKTAATEVVSSGENALNEMGENITEGVGQMKETIVETVNGMKDSIGDVINDGMTKIPLNDTMESTNHLLEENLENLKNEMMNKTQSIGDEADKITDELIKDTEDVIRDAETGMVDMKNDAVETMETVKNDIMEELNMNNSPSHSIETSVPEPEIERIMNGDDNPASPKATINEMENLNMEPEEEALTVPEEPSMESKEEEALPEETPPMKVEDELVVEDIKDETSPVVERPIGKKLQKSLAVHETDSSDDEMSKESEVVPGKTHWEELQDIYFQKRYIRDLHASVESLLEDEDACKINLSNLYQENQPSEKSSSTLTKDVSQDTLDAIDELIKSFEKETNEIKDDAQPTVTVTVE